MIAPARIMTITVTLFADLRRFLPRGADGPQRYAVPEGATLADLLAMIGIEPGADVTAAVNGELAGRETPLHDGAEVMLLSPMEGGAAADGEATMELERPLPHPITPEARPYWDGARDGKLMIPKCRACGKAFLYPRVLCPACASRDIAWIQASGRGRLHTFAIAYQILNKAFRVKTPVILAMVELEEGPRLLTNLVGVAPDPKALRCDMPVEVVFEKLTDQISLPLFRPAAATTGGAR